MLYLIEIFNVCNKELIVKVKEAQIDHIMLFASGRETMMTFLKILCSACFRHRRKTKKSRLCTAFTQKIIPQFMICLNSSRIT